MSMAIIGGSGLYKIDDLHEIHNHDLDTPYGKPSASIKKCRLADTTIFFLPRHGQNHHLLPHEINHRANIWALKSLGVSNILSFSAVGSLKENFHPCDLALIDQYVDHTKKPAQTFFGQGAIAHVSLAEPACENLRQQIKDVAFTLKGKEQQIHPAATYINIEGPQFSTKAESKLFRSWGMDVIGMTNFPEAKLAREAEICYLTIAMITDYDCWHKEHAAVTVEQVMENLSKNAAFAKSIIVKALPHLQTHSDCDCQNALKKGLLTPLSAIPESTRQDLEPLLRKYS